MRTLPVLSLCLLALLSPACGDAHKPNAPTITVVPQVSGTAEEPPPPDTELADLESPTSGLRGPSGDGRAQAVPDIQGLGGARLLELRVIAPKASPGKAPPRVILLDARRIAGGAGGDDARARSRWDWGQAETIGDEIATDGEWQRDDATSFFTVKIPRPSRRIRVFARLGSHVATANLSSGRTRTVTLDLSEPISIHRTVLVTDAGGSPVEDIEVLAGSRKVRRLPPAGLELAPGARRTDELGCAELTARPSQVIAARVIGLPPVFAKAVDAAPNSPHRIQLPAATTVRVELKFPLGVSIPKGSAPPYIELKGRWLNSGGPKTDTFGVQDGIATLYPVGTRQALRVQAFADGWQGKAAFDSPEADGDEMTVVVPMVRSPLIHLIAVTDSGKPLVGATLGFRVGTSRSREYLAITDSKGRALCVLKGQSPGMQVQRVFVRELLDTQDPNDGRVALVSLDAAAQGSVELGTVTLGRVPILVAGRVLDTAGEGVKSARLQVAPLDDPQSAATKTRRSQPFPGSVEWATARSGPDGAFVIRYGLPGDPSPDGPLALDASRKDALTHTPIAFAPGALDVTVLVTPSSALKIDTTQLKTRDLRDFTLALKRNGEAVKSIRLEKNQVIRRLREGIYQLELKGPGHSKVAIVEDIRLLPGATLKDPRLNPLNVTSLVEIRTLHVSAANGEPPTAIQFGSVKAASSDNLRWLPVIDGYVRIPVWLDADPTSYVADATGLHRVELSVLRDGDTIAFKEAIQITLQLEGAELPGMPFEMYLYQISGRDLVMIGPDRGAQILQFDADGRASAKIPCAGQYALTQGFSDRSEAGRPWWGTKFSIPESGGQITVQKAPL